MMKVLLCSPKGNTGGIARWTTHILDYYAKNVKDIELRWCYAAPSKRNMLATTPKLVRTYYGLVNYLPFLKQLKKELKDSHYDIVHFVNSGSMSLLRDIFTLRICKRKGVSSVVHFRFGRIPDILKQKNWEYRLLDYVISHSSKAIVIDKSSYDALLRHGYKNIFILPNPLTPKISDIIEKNRNLKRQSRHLLFAGHCVPTKGIYELIDACKEIPNIHLTMIGICEEAIKKELSIRAGEGSKEWLEIKGDQSYENVIKEMLQCAIFVLPTYTEGFPNVIIESMACGCPIITTPVGAIPEMLNIDSDSQCGILVPTRNVDSLKGAILKLLSSDKLSEELGQRARERVNSEYAMPIIWKKLSDIWTA